MAGLLLLKDRIHRRLKRCSNASGSMNARCLSVTCPMWSTFRRRMLHERSAEKRHFMALRARPLIHRRPPASRRPLQPLLPPCRPPSPHRLLNRHRSCRRPKLLRLALELPRSRRPRPVPQRARGHHRLRHRRRPTNRHPLASAYNAKHAMQRSNFINTP